MDINEVYSNGFKTLIFKTTLVSDVDINKSKNPYIIIGNIITASLDLGINIRIYKTFSGFHVFVTNKLFFPRDKETIKTLYYLKCDPKYIAFTIKKNCWQIRSSPKPNRIGIKIKRNFNCYSLGYLEKEKYIKKYENASIGYKSCEFIMQTFENEPMTKEAASVIKKYEKITKCNYNYPIA